MTQRLLFFFLFLLFVGNVVVPTLPAEQASTPAPDSLIGKAIQVDRELTAAMVSKNEKKTQEIAPAIFALDTDKMPPEWRHAFAEEQLGLYSHLGNWKGMLSIKNKLMSKKHVSKTDDLIDADLLLQISRFYTGSFPPPPEIRKNDGSPEYTEFAMEYGEKNYRDDKERERIYQYIVDNFDPNYAPVYMARGNLAGVQYNSTKRVLAYANYLICDRQDLKKLYCLPKADILSAKVLSGKEVMESEYSAKFLRRDKEVIQSEMLRITEGVGGNDADKAIEALRKLRKSHLDSATLREKIEERLRELSLKSDLIIPAEELGLPNVTSGTLATSATLTTSNTLSTTKTK